MSQSKLDKNGCIPEKTFCPFKDECEIWQADECMHSGDRHQVPFSCAIARAFDIVQEQDNENQ